MSLQNRIPLSCEIYSIIYTICLSNSSENRPISDFRDGYYPDMAMRLDLNRHQEKVVMDASHSIEASTAGSRR